MPNRLDGGSGDHRRLVTAAPQVLEARRGSVTPLRSHPSQAREARIRRDCTILAFSDGDHERRRHWVEIIAAIRAAGMQSTMTTGGPGLTAERARAAAAAGLQSASVSIDDREATHDRLRGVGSRRTALEAARNLKAAGAGLSVNT